MGEQAELSPVHDRRWQVQTYRPLLEHRRNPVREESVPGDLWPALAARLAQWMGPGTATAHAVVVEAPGYAGLRRSWRCPEKVGYRRTTRRQPKTANTDRWLAIGHRRTAPVT